MIGLNVSAQDVTDVLTWEALGLNAANSSYAEYTGIKITSNAVYTAQASSGTGKYIQLRTNNNNAGIVTTTSGGKLKSVTITFNSATTDRAIEIYGKNEAYTAATDLYGDAKGTLLKTIAANDDSKTLTVEGDYTFVGLKSANGAIYVDKIEITWAASGGQVQTKTATAIEFSGNYLTKFTPGKDGDKVDLPTATVKAGDAAVEGATVTWTLTKGTNWSADADPAINGTKVEFGDHSRGDLTLKASYAGNDTYEASTKSYTLKVYKGYMAIKSILEDFPKVGGDTWKAKEAEWKAGTPISYWQVDAKSETEFTSKEALVTFVSGSYTYIKDNDGSLLLFGSDLGFKKGDKISGDLGNDKGYGAIYGTLKTYNGLLELAVNKADIEFVVKSSDNAVEAKTITIDQLDQANMNEYVKIENAEFVSADNKNLKFKVGEVELAVYNQFGVDAAFEAGTKYNLYGMGCIYYKNEVVTPQLYLVEFEKATVAADTWTVAGTLPLVDKSWDPSDATADMTSTDGVTYTYVKEDITLEKGTEYKFKVVKNYAWDEAYPASDYIVTVTETAKYKATITFNATTKEVNCVTEKTGSAGTVEHTYGVVGTLVGSWDNDVDMTKGEDGLFKAVIESVAKGNYEFKVRADKGWDISYPSSNYKLEVAEDNSTVTVTFNEETKEVKATVAAGTAGSGVAWDFTVLPTQKIDGTGNIETNATDGMFTEDEGAAWQAFYNKEAIDGAEFTATASEVLELTKGLKWYINGAKKVYYRNYPVESGGKPYGGKYIFINDGDNATEVCVPAKKGEVIVLIGSTAKNNKKVTSEDVAETFETTEGETVHGVIIDGTTNYDWKTYTLTVTRDNPFLKFEKNMCIQKIEVKDASGINTLNANAKVYNGAIYNLAGQKVGKDYKGIVIMNGKKFMQK